MRAHDKKRLKSIGAGTFALMLLLPGCLSPGERARLVQENESLSRAHEKLERTVANRDNTISILHTRIRNLEEFGPDRPADLFSPVEVEIASLTGGANYDGRPGDNGVTVYVRLRDADGDLVKAPGRITVQLLDNSELERPRLMGVYRFDDPSQLRTAWYGKFGTYHYTLKCPFGPGSNPPLTNKIDIKVEFVDYLTGVTLTAIKQVTVTPARETDWQAGMAAP